MSIKAPCFISLLAVMLIGLLLLACGGTGNENLTPNSSDASINVTANLVPSPTVLSSLPTSSVPLLGTPPNPLKVVGVDELAIPPEGTAYLSPNGNIIAWIKGNQFCLYTSTGQKKNCISDKEIDANSVQWSPDSSRLVFTESFFRDQQEPDI